MSDPASVRERFDQALASFVEKARADDYVLAVILFGSLSHDTVWEKSDIDLMVITRDQKPGAYRNSLPDNYCLVENGINLHASIEQRGRFKRSIEGAVQGSFGHSSFAKSRLVFTRDETIRQLYENIQRLGSRDRQVQLLRSASCALACLYKAEKWFHVRKDLEYSFVWILNCITPLAQIEVYLDGQIPGREVIPQALQINPGFFKPIYTDLINQKKSARQIATALESIDGYLTRKKRVLFQPILDFLAEAGAPRSATEIQTYFKNQMNADGTVTACEWLADKDVIAKVSTPARLTPRSRVTVDEMAFYYDGE